MSLVNKRICIETLPFDSISNLPEEVLDHILVLMPLPDAVRTSILSKKWQYKWCRITKLTLDQTLWKIDQPRYFENIIRHILDFHGGQVKHFTLSIPFLEDFTYVRRLLGFLSESVIEHLILKFPIRETPYKLPASFFTCVNLKHISLEDCLLSPTRAFNGFGMLISLKLYNVTVVATMLERLISNCPLLEQLVLEISDSFSDVIEISASKLKSLEFKGRVNYIRLKTIPLLEKLSLALRGEYVVGSIPHITSFFGSFSALENLHLDNRSVKIMAASAGQVPTSLPFHVDCVKHLYLDDIYQNELSFVACVLCLMRSFPYLEYLEIKVDISGVPLALDNIDLEERFGDTTFNNLRVIVIRSIRRINPHMQLLRLLLAKSPALQRIKILALTYEDSESIKALTDRPGFQCASPEAEIILKVQSR